MKDCVGVRSSQCHYKRKRKSDIIIGQGESKPDELHRKSEDQVKMIIINKLIKAGSYKRNTGKPLAFLYNDNNQLEYIALTKKFFGFFCKMLWKLQWEKD